MSATGAIPVGAPIDVSVTIHPGMPIYDGDPGVSIDLVRALDRGDAANVSRLELGAHTGTHVDAPAHFIRHAPGADQLEVDRFVGPCVVADATHAAGEIDAALVEGLGLPEEARRVRLKTANSRLWERASFTSDFVRLNGCGAHALIERGLILVGIDYLSIGDREAHLALLARGIGVIEGLDLRAVEAGAYFLTCLPVKIAGCDGAPARALLWRLDH
jgi:arylformamidase